MRTLLATLFVLASGSYGHAQCSETKLLASDGDELGWFGYAIALEGDRLLVPAKHDEDPLERHCG